MARSVKANGGVIAQPFNGGKERGDKEFVKRVVSVVRGDSCFV